MSRFYSKLPVISKALRTLLIKSYSTSPQKPSQAVTKSVTEKPAKAQKDAGGGGSKSVGGSGNRGREGCSSKSTVNLKHMDDKCDMFDIPKGNSKPYRMLSYCMMTMIIAVAYNMFSHQEEHDNHFVPYSYMYLRNKRFFWGDHRKSFFHGPNNFIPDEEESKYKKLADADEEDLKRRKELRDLHAKEELERRKRRRDQEASK